MNRYLLLFCLGNIFLFSASAQYPSKKDSLLELYQNQKDDSLRINTLNLLFRDQLYTVPENAKQYAMEMLEISRPAKFEYGMLIGNYDMGNYYYNQRQLDTAEHYYQSALFSAKKLQLKSKQATVLSGLAKVAMANGKYDMALSLEDSVATIFKNENDYLGYGIALGNMAANHMNKGNYAKALEGYMQALKALDTISEEPFRKADILRDIGKLNHQQGNYEQSITYYNEAIEVYQTISDHLYTIYTITDIGNAYLGLNQYDRAIENYQKSLVLSKTHDYPENIAINNVNLGIAFREKDNYDEALQYFLKGLNTKGYQITSINDIIYRYQIGLTYTLLNEFDQALDYLNASVAIAERTNTHNELKFALEFRALTYEKKGQFNLALKDQKRYQMIKDSLFTLEKNRQIEELQTIYDTEKKEAALALQEEEIKTLNEKAKVDSLTKGLYAGGMFSFVAISGLLFFGFRQRIKKNRIAREKQEAIYQQEIEHKKKELASQTLHLVQKNTFLQELKENLDKIKKSPELFKMEFRRLTMLLRKQTAEDKDWEVFKSYFADVHDNFDNRLRALHQDITDKEIRLAAFLRMDLNTKEIAAMMNVIPTSVLTSKYRLKKKLGLDKETDLGSFLNTL